MSLILDGTSGVTFPNSTVQASAGQVLQVVNATNTTQTSNSTTTLTDTSLTATITPKFATSKVLIILTQAFRKESSDTSLMLTMFRNSTNIGAVSYTYLDSPASTSAVTYKTQFASQNNSASVTINFNGDYSSITLMEIAQ